MKGGPLLNFEGAPGILLLNFEGGPGVSLLNFERVPGPEVLVLLLHHACKVYLKFISSSYKGLSRFTAPGPLDSKFEVLFVKIFSLKQKTNPLTPAVVSSRK